MSTLFEPAVDLSKQESFIDGVPHETFDWLRENSPVHWCPAETGTLTGGFWSLTRHADIARVNRDYETFTSTKGPVYPVTLEMIEMNAGSMMFLDPPEHVRLRTLAGKAFSPRVVARFEEWIRHVVSDVLDGLETEDSYDFVTKVAGVIPALVIAEVMGVDPSDRHHYIEAADLTFNRELSKEDFDRYIAELPRFFEYLLKLRESKIANPQTDVVTELINAAPQGEPLSDAEFTLTLYLLLTAGFDTTHTLMGQTMRLMLEDDRVADLIRENVEEGKAAAVVDELLRYISPVMHMARTATRDVELGGVTIPKDDMVVMWHAAGNRDPKVFPDPHKFDPGRDNSRILSFGGGPHFCMGNHLARREMKIFLEEIVRRRINLRLAGTPVRGYSATMNLLTSLPVARV